jgi:hypothetical protein
MKEIRRIYPYGPAVGEYTSKGTVAETFARVRKQLDKPDTRVDTLRNLGAAQPNRPHI